MIRKLTYLGLFIISTSVAIGQSLSLPKTEYVIGEDVYFDVVLPLEDTSSYFWIQLLDPMNLYSNEMESLAAFQFHLVDGSLHQGRFNLNIPTLHSGPYFLTAYTAAGKSLGLRSIFAIQASDKEHWHDLMLSRSAVLDSSLLLFKIPDLAKITLEAKGQEYALQSWEEVRKEVKNYADEYLKISLVTSEGTHHHLVLPPPNLLIQQAKTQKTVNMDDGLWFYNTKDYAQEYAIQWRENVITEFGLDAKDSVELVLPTYPTGVIRIVSKDQNREILNKPIPLQLDTSKINISPNSQYSLTIPSLRHAFRDEGYHFIQVQISRGSSSFGMMPKDVEAQILDKRPFIRTWVEPKESLDKSFFGLVLMDSTSQFAVPTAEDGSYEMSAAMAYQLSRGEGRVRLGQMNKQQEVKVAYPQMEDYWDELTKSISESLPELRWNYDFPVQQYLEQDFASWELIDLDEVVVNAKSDDELLDAMKLQPFSIDWINTDFTCAFGVYNCSIPSHGFGTGNRVNSGDQVRFRLENIPLHIYIKYIFSDERERALIKTRSKIAALGLDPNKYDLEKVVVISNLHARDGRRSSQNAGSISYDWKPEPYLKNMAKMHLFHDNEFEGLLEGLDIIIKENQSKWMEYSDDMEISFKSSYLTGTYRIQISYWDLYHNLSTTLNYVVEVSN